LCEQARRVVVVMGERGAIGGGRDFSSKIYCILELFQKLIFAGGALARSQIGGLSAYI
jgi:hypothetical protein